LIDPEIDNFFIELGESDSDSNETRQDDSRS